jgi:arylsulfatase
VPNVLIVLLDDVGFGASSAFGGPINMPTAQRLADGGLRYNRFHTTALCSPTRAALLAGRNHHSVGMGGITEIATSAPGYNSLRPNTMAPLAEILRLNGYSTSQFGKCHEVPVWETSPMGPFDHWPSPGNGMEHFYGFIGGETNQYYPALYDGTQPVEPWGTPEQGYHFMDDMTDKAIGWMHAQKSLMPDEPFFMYFAPGATHAPHHVPKEWADKYKGKFDQGWDRVREETLARQKQTGSVPADTRLTEWDERIPAWDATDERIRPFLAREMEVYAGFLEYADHHVGVLIDAMAELGELDNTLIYYLIGDNGASAEGTMQGTLNESFTLNHATALETPDYLMQHIDDLGTPVAYNHYAIGWAHAMCTPFQWPSTSPPSIRPSWPSCSGCSSSRRPNTTYCRWTTVPPSASTRGWPVDRNSLPATYRRSTRAWCACPKFDHQSQEPLVHGQGFDRCSRRRRQRCDRGAGRHVRRVVLLPARGPTPLLLEPARG